MLALAGSEKKQLVPLCAGFVLFREHENTAKFRIVEISDGLPQRLLIA
jgi:hypothetical protein